MQLEECLAEGLNSEVVGGGGVMCHAEQQQIEGLAVGCHQVCIGLAAAVVARVAHEFVVVLQAVCCRGLSHFLNFLLLGNGKSIKIVFAMVK